MENIKDKMVTLRFSPIDIYMANYVYYNNMANEVRNCPDMIDVLVCKLRAELIGESSSGKINKLLNQYRKLRITKPFNVDSVDIAGTKLYVSKPYNVFVNSKVISDLQNHIIKNTEIKKPHSSWIIQISILNAFLPLAKKLGDFDINKDAKNNDREISEVEKLDMIENFVKLFKNAKQNADKINQIKEILEK